MFSLQYIQACRSTSNTIPGRLEKLVSEQIAGGNGSLSRAGSNTSLSASLQVKLSGSHLTPQCYSFITYVQVGSKITVAKSYFICLMQSGESDAVHGHLLGFLIFLT